MSSQHEIKRILRTASRHKRSFNDSVVAEAGKNPELIRERKGAGKIVYARYKAVVKENAKLRSLTRLQVYPERLLVGRIDDEHKVGDLVLGYFMNKFPTFFTVIFSNYGLFCGSKKIRLDVEPFGTSDEDIIEEIRKKMEKKIRQMGLRKLKNVEFEKEVWEMYYDSQYVPQRKNVKAQNNVCIPCKERLEQMRHYLRKKENKSLKQL